MNTALWTVQVLWGVFFSLPVSAKFSVTSRPCGTKRSMKRLGLVAVPLPSANLTLGSADPGGWYSTPETIYCGKA